MSRRALLVAALIAGALALAASALAATGSLTYRTCVANAGADGCEAPARKSLSNNLGLTVSPDGGTVYVAGFNGTLTRMTRDLVTGDLTFLDCFADRGEHRCRDVPHDSLDGASGIAVSPDGGSVYVTSGEPTNAINRFKLAGTGKLRYRSCVANRGRHAGRLSCARPPHNSLDSNEAIALAPDGRSAYVVSSGSDSITWFKVGSSGGLRYRGCIADRGQHGCRNPRHDSLGGAFDVAVSPDGKSVYVASLTANAITRFDRGATGALAYEGCIANRGKFGCRKIKGNALGGADAVAVSPDGGSVYVAAFRASAVTTLDRTQGGWLSPAGCFANFADHGCEQPLQNSLAGANGIAVSPDGRSVYVSAMSGPSINGGAGALSTFSRAADGSLRSLGCFADDAKHECVAPPLASLNSPESVAVSPDGRSVYVGSYNRSLSIFDRESALP